MQEWTRYRSAGEVEGNRIYGRGSNDMKARVAKDATATWYQSWFPRVAQANGRSYLHQLDDVKDHQAARIVDWSYLVYRELLIAYIAGQLSSSRAEMSTPQSTTCLYQTECGLEGDFEGRCCSLQQSRVNRILIPEPS